MVSLGAVEMLVQSLWPEERHAAVAVPDKRRGERIVLVTTADDADPDELRQFGKQAGAAELMVPNDIVKVEEIPVLGSGKTDYVSTRKLAIERLRSECGGLMRPSAGTTPSRHRYPKAAASLLALALGAPGIGAHAERQEDQIAGDRGGQRVPGIGHQQQHIEHDGEDDRQHPVARSSFTLLPE